MLNVKKFSIICDLDGKILSFDHKCENFFKLLKKDVVGIERIYNLISSDFVIFFIDKFNYFKNTQIDVYNVSVVLNNSISINLVLRQKFNKKFIIVDFFDLPDVLIKPKKSFLTSINLIFRSKFTLGSILPFFFSFFFIN